jgi:hypothetical protein
MEYLNYEEELDGFESVIEEIDTPETEEVAIVEPLPVEESTVIETETPISPTKKEKLADSLDEKTVALYSSKNFVAISQGYSKVEKDLAKELLKNKNIRKATLEEIEQHFNK